ncbi:phosphoribosyltransferase family protein, partial [Campylobacter jejuni]|uniref:phosphoribosyltransferase family protein n=1 Tax=Campylobacter jejuni TaxID=197 RepID=UPI002F267144
LVDDIIDTAGTIVKAAEALKEKGAKSVMACCTHAVLSGKAYEGIVSEVEPAIQYTDIKDSFVDIELAEPSKQVITQSNTPKEIQKP